MATARQAQLQEQRSKFAPYGRFDRIRVLAPSDTSVSTISRRTIMAEIERMGDRYIDGEISNEEMFKFLETQKNNPILTPNERVNLEDQIRDYKVLIRKDQLEAVYQAAPDNSQEKITAADSLARFYQDRASGMMAGTPAQSNALSDAAVWQARADQEREQIQKQGRTIQRLQAEANIATFPTGSSEKEIEKAQAYADLYNTALSEGEMVEANRYLVQAQTAQTKAQEYLAKETTAEQKEQIRTYEAQKRAEIEKMSGDSPSELTARYQLYMELGDAYAEIGDTARSFQYQTKAYQTEERYNKMMETQSNKAIKNEISYIKKEIQTLENHYRYSIPYKEENLTAPQYLAAKAVLLEQAISYTGEAIDDGISGLDASLSVLEKDYLDVSDKLERMGLARTEDGWQPVGQSTLVETIGKNGRKELTDITDPDVAAKYARGEQFYYPIETPRSTAPGGGALGREGMEALYQQGRAYIRQNEQGFETDKSGKPIVRDEQGIYRPVMLDENEQPVLDEAGQPTLDPLKISIPDYVPEQYADVRTPDNKTERVWSIHDQEGNFQGWIPEKTPLAEADKLYKAADKWRAMNVPVLPQTILTEPSYKKYIEERNKIAAYQPKEGEELYYGVNESGMPFSETRAAGPTTGAVAKIPKTQATEQVSRTPEGELKYEPIASKGYTMPIPRTEPVSYTQPIPKIELPKLPSFTDIGKTFQQTSPAINLQQYIAPKIEPIKKAAGNIWEKAKKGLSTTLSKLKFW